MRAYKDAITGDTAPKVGRYPIATGTAVVAGQPVVITNGVVVAAAVDATAAILGVAAESHSGSSTSIYQSDFDLTINVYDNPAQIFEVNAPQITATSGSTTTIVATGLDAFADDAFNYGKAKLISKVAGSTNTDALNTVYTISDYEASSNTLTINTAVGAVTAGDIFEIYPPLMFATFEFDSTVQYIDLSGDDGTMFKVVGYDTKRGTVQLMPTLHLFGNKYA